MSTRKSGGKGVCNGSRARCVRIGAISIGARPQSTGLDKIDPRRRLPDVTPGQCVTVSTLMGFKVWKFGI